jgi:hypothetical protein
MGEACEVTARPLTRIRKRIAAAAADDSNKTNRDVAKAAGVHEVSVCVALKNPKVLSEVETQIAKRVDKARGLANRGLDRMHDLLDRADMQETALATKVGHDIAKDSPEETERVDPEEEKRALRRYAALGWRLCLLHFRQYIPLDMVVANPITSCERRKQRNSALSNVR